MEVDKHPYGIRLGPGFSLLNALANSFLLLEALLRYSNLGGIATAVWVR